MFLNLIFQTLPSDKLISPTPVFETNLKTQYNNTDIKRHYNALVHAQRGFAA